MSDTEINNKIVIVAVDSYNWERINNIIRQYEKHKEDARRKRREDIIKAAAEKGKEKRFAKDSISKFPKIEMNIISVIVREDLKNCEQYIRKKFPEIELES